MSRVSDLKLAARALKATKNNASALARELGTTRGTVTQWTKTGVSKKHKPALEAFVKNAVTSKKKARDDVQVFSELMKRSGEIGMLRKHKSRSWRRVGPRSTGWAWTKGFGELLSEGLIQRIKTWFRGLEPKQRWPLWQGMAQVSQFGGTGGGLEGVNHSKYVTVHVIMPEGTPERAKGEFRPANTIGKRLLQVKGPDGKPMLGSGDFTAEAVVPTHKSTRREVVVQSLAGNLIQILDAGFLGFVHAVTVFNYRLRTDSERKAFNTRTQREKQKIWKKKQKAGKKTAKILKKVKKLAKKLAKKTAKKRNRSLKQLAELKKKSVQKASKKSTSKISSATITTRKKTKSKKTTTTTKKTKLTLVKPVMTKTKKTPKKTMRSTTTLPKKKPTPTKSSLLRSPSPAKKTAASATKSSKRVSKKRTAKASGLTVLKSTKNSKNLTKKTAKKAAKKVAKKTAKKATTKKTR